MIGRHIEMVCIIESGTGETDGFSFSFFFKKGLTFLALLRIWFPLCHRLCGFTSFGGHGDGILCCHQPQKILLLDQSRHVPDPTRDLVP